MLFLVNWLALGAVVGVAVVVFLPVVLLPHLHSFVLLPSACHVFLVFFFCVFFQTFLLQKMPIIFILGICSAIAAS